MNLNIPQIKTEPVAASSSDTPGNSFFHEIRGPFQFYQHNFVEHPIQPDDDVSVRDPTIKTYDKSKLSQSPHLLRSAQNSAKSLDVSKIDSDLHTSQILAFSQQSQETTLRLKKTSGKFIQLFRDKFKFDRRIHRFLRFFNEDQGHPFPTRSITQRYASITFLSPSDTLFKAWSLVFLLLLTIMALYLPIELSFNLPNLDLYFALLKILDVAVTLASTICVNGVIISEWPIIFRNYIYCQALHDFFALTSLFMIMIRHFGPLSNILLLFLLLMSSHRRYSTLLTYLKFEYNLYDSQKEVFFQSLRILILLNLAVALWHQSMMMSDSELPMAQHYITALYFVVGFFSLNAHQLDSSDALTPQDQLIYTLFQLFALLLFAYLIRIVLSVPHDNRVPEMLNSFFKQNRINSILKHKIVSNFKGTQKYNHQAIVSHLAPQLINEFNNFQRQEILSKYFHSYSPYLISQLVSACEDIVTQPNQVILRDKEIDDCAIYFILEGHFNIIITKSHQYMALKQAFFGELSFFTELPRSATVISEGVSRLLKLKRSEFLKFVDYHDKQRFFQAQVDILHNRRFPSQCFACSKGDHYILSCPLFFYHPDRERIIKAFLFPQKQKRQPCIEAIYKDQRRAALVRGDPVLQNMSKRPLKRTKKTLKAWDFAREAEACQEDLFQLYSENKIQSSNNLHSQSQIPYEDVMIRDSNTSARSLTKISREKSIIKSASMMKQHSIYENSNIGQDNNFILGNEQDHEFSIIGSDHRIQDTEENEFNNLVRRDNQKRTFATAGFGHQSVGQQSIKDASRSLNVIQENEGSEGESNSNENFEESPIQLDVHQRQIRRTNDPKLTFNNNFEMQMNDLQLHSPLQRLGSGSKSTLRQHSQQNSQRQNSHKSGLNKPDSIRQGSARSLTYSPIPSNMNTQNVSGNNFSNRSIFNQVSSSNLPKQRKSIVSMVSNRSQVVQYNQQHSDNLAEARSMRSRRKSSRKKSTRTGTKVSMVPSSFQPFSGFENIGYGHGAQFGIDGFERLIEYEYFQPHNNYEITIRQANSCGRKHKLKKLNHYVFSYNLGYQLYRIRYKAQKRLQENKANQK